MRPRHSLALAALALLCAPLAVTQTNPVDQVLAQCGAEPYSYDGMLKAVTALDRSDRVWVVSIGQSREGRSIPLVTVHHPQTVYGQTARLFIIARQHGTEMAGTEAVMALMRHLCQSNQATDLELLRRVTFAIVPMVNPDGVVAWQRYNATDVDLNRDWASPSQPETKAVEWAFRVWRPNVFIDCHELPASSSKAAFQENFLQTIADDPALDRNMTQFCGSMADNVRRCESAYGARMNIYYDSHDEDRRLAHRRFGLDFATPSFLLESKTGSGYSLRDRIRYHVVGTLVIANLLAQRVAAPSVPIQPTIPRPQTPVYPQPPAQQYAAKTEVVFVSPARDRLSFSQDIALQVDVEAAADFAYLSVHVDGIRRIITDAPPYEGSLSVEHLADGTHTVVCQAHDNSGRVLAAAERLVVVNTNVAGQ